MVLVGNTPGVVAALVLVLVLVLASAGVVGAVVVEPVLVALALDVVAVEPGDRAGTVVVVRVGVDGAGLGTIVVGGLTVSPRGPM